MTNPYSPTPEEQAALAAAMTASPNASPAAPVASYARPYSSPDDLAALHAAVTGQPPPVVPSNAAFQGMLPAPPPAPGVMDRVSNWARGQLPESMQGKVTQTPDEKAADEAKQKAADAERLKTAQFAPPATDGASGTDTAAGGAGAPSPQAPSAPVQVNPQHWVDTMDPGNRAMMDAGQAAQLEGVGGEADAQSKAYDEMARAAYHGHEDDRVQQLLDKLELDKQRGALEQHMAELQQRADDIAQKKIDPDHWTKNQSTGQRIILALAAGLAGGAAFLRGGGDNPVLENIQHAIDSDIKAQAADIENSKEGLKSATGLLADKWRLFDNKEKAMAAARQEALASTASQIDDIARQHKSPEVMANAEQLEGQLLQKFAAEGASTNKFVPAQAVGGGLTRAQRAEKALELVKAGVQPNLDEALSAVDHAYGIGGSNQVGHYDRAATAAGKGISPDSLPTHLTSTAAIPGLISKPGTWTDLTQDSKSAQQARDLDRFNAAVLAYSHTVGIRDPEKGEHVYKAYTAGHKDSQKTLDEKLNAFRELLAKQPMPVSGGSGAPDKLPGEEPIQ